MARSPSGTGAADTVDEAGSTAATALEPGPTVVLLVAHGSRNPAAGVEHERLCTAGQQQLDDDVTAGVDRTEVRPAYLEIAAPDIPTAIDRAVADGAGSVRVLPHFLAPGNHVSVDIPRIVDDARSRHQGVQIELLEHLGADPALVGLLARRATHT